MSERCYLGLGSNLASPRQQLCSAVTALSELPNTRLIACSGLYTSQPMGPSDQPDYMNAVVALETDLAPLELLDETQRIELEQGRVRKAERWGPRTLDIDLLLFAQQSINLPRLQVPHYGLEVREFVVIPLFEIAPQLILPNGRQLADIAATIPLNQLQCCASAEQWTGINDYP